MCTSFELLPTHDVYLSVCLFVLLRLRKFRFVLTFRFLYYSSLPFGQLIGAQHLCKCNLSFVICAKQLLASILFCVILFAHLANLMRVSFSQHFVVIAYSSLYLHAVLVSIHIYVSLCICCVHVNMYVFEANNCGDKINT